MGSTDSASNASAISALMHDHRRTPRGVLPRNLQMWLMAGLAVVILVIIFLTGHAAPPPRALTSVPGAEPALAAAERIRGYRQQLADEQVRQQHLAGQSPESSTRPREPNEDAATRDPLAD